MEPFLKTILADPDRSVLSTTQGVRIRASRLARTIQCVREGLEARAASGARVATLLPDDWATAAFVLGAWDVVSVFPLNPALGIGTLTDQIREAGVSAIIGQPNDANGQQLAANAGVLFIPVDDLLEHRPHTGGPIPGAATALPGLLLLTSGSTGMPKRVALPTHALVTSARTIAQTLALGPGDRALLSLPMFHIGAFVDLLLAPLLAGGEVVIAPQRGASALWAAIPNGAPTWIQLVPTMLTDLLRNPPDTQMKPGTLRFIRSVSSGLSADLQSRAEAAFGCPVIQMYGMTETAGQIASNPLPPAVRKPLSVGRPAGAEISIRHPDDRPVPTGQVGEICVQGPAVFDGYEGTGPSALPSDGWFRTGDLGRFDADGYLFIEGRLKEIINRGGEKISPFIVERAALDLDGVHEAAAYAVPHPTLGEQVGLAVVADPGVSDAMVLAHLSDRLSHFQMPRSVRLMQALPRLAGGKIDKRDLARTHPDAPPSTNTAATGNPRVAALWARILDTSEPEIETDFFDAGGDSLAATTFILELEKLIGRQVSPNILFDHPRFGDLCAALLADAANPQESAAIRHVRFLMAGWRGKPAVSGGLLRQFSDATARAPLFWCCQGFAEIGPVLQAVGTARAVYAASSLFQMKGRSMADRREIAARFASEIREICPDSPVTLGGYCEGAQTMGFVAEALLQSGHPARLLVSADHWFQAPTAFPVFHVQSRDKRDYPKPELAFRFLHPNGAGIQKMQALHADLVVAIPEIGDRLNAVLDQEEMLAVPGEDGASVVPRTELYKARLRARVPWIWPGDRQMQFEVTVQNRSNLTWRPTSESGLALMALVADLTGKVRDRFAGYAEFSKPVSPGADITLNMTVSHDRLHRPHLLCLQLVDQGVADFPRGSGGLAVYPRWSPFTRRAG